MKKKREHADKAGLMGLASYGQHYLNDTSVLDLLLKSANLSQSDNVLEIGAGDGRITRELAERVGWVYAYEIDSKTKSDLLSLSSQYKNVTIFWGNFLALPVPDDVSKVVASLPYQITEPFVEKMARTKVGTILLIIGKTFADHVCAEFPSTKLALLTNCYFFPKVISEINPESFSPPPRTMSVILSLQRKEKSVLANDTSMFLMRELFEQRDKKLTNALKEALIRLYQARGETLTQRESKSLIKEVSQKVQIDTNKSIEQMKNSEIKTMFESLSYFDGK